MAAFTLRADSRRLTAAVDECPSCDYPRAGLSADARCPECGASPTAGPPSEVLEGSAHTHLLIVGCVVPVLQAVLSPDLHLVFAFLMWAMGACVVVSWISIVRPRIPARRARSLLIACVVGFLLGALLTAGGMVLMFDGSLRPSHYGAPFDIAITGALFGPMLAVSLSGWAFTIEAAVHGRRSTERETERRRRSHRSE